jgi:hypothetical protein
VLYVYNAQGGGLVANDDMPGSPDSYVRFAVPADGHAFGAPGEAVRLPSDEGAARAAVRLAGVLAAARRTPEAVDPAGEEAALAAFRAARRQYEAEAAGTRAVGRGGVPWWRTAGAAFGVLGVRGVGVRGVRGTPARRAGAGERPARRAVPGRVAVAALASVLALGGVTVALAGTVRLPLPGGGSGSGTGPVTREPSGPVSPRTATGRPAPVHPPASPASPATPSSPASTGPAVHSLAWCRTYLRGLQRHLTSPSPGVTSYCLRLTKGSGTGHGSAGGRDEDGGTHKGNQKGEPSGSRHASSSSPQSSASSASSLGNPGHDGHSASSGHRSESAAGSESGSASGKRK